MVNSKELLQKLMSGSHGITRDGNRAIYIGKELYSSEDEFPHAFLIVESEIKNSEIEWYSEDLKYNSQNSLEDIIGLWKEKPERFNLDRALAGEPLIDLHNNEKLWLYKSHKDGSLITEYENTHNHLEDVNPLEYLGDVKDLSQCFGMWKEPELISSADDLPKPIKNFGDLKEVWYVESNTHKNIYEPNKLNKGRSWTKGQHVCLNNGFYYATKEDCQKICDWLMNR